jgi:hypothetical protein
MKKMKFLSAWLVALLLSISTSWSQQPLTYLSYNILEGFKSDSVLKADFTKWIKDKNPDW